MLFGLADAFGRTLLRSENDGAILEGGSSSKLESSELDSVSVRLISTLIGIFLPGTFFGVPASFLAGAGGGFLAEGCFFLGRPFFGSLDRKRGLFLLPIEGARSCQGG